VLQGVVGDNAWLWLVCGLFGSMIAVLTASKGTFGFSKVMGKICNTARKTMFATYIMGILIFIDDYLNVLSIGTCMKGLFDKKKLPRESLAFILDSTGAPVCVLLPVSTWAVFYANLFMEQPAVSSQYSSPMNAYLSAIPFCFYPIVALLIVALFNVVLIALLYWFFGTEFGCGIRATGCNANMARAQGVNTELNKIIGLVMSNGIVALSGALLTQYQGFADVSMGRGAIVIGLAAVIIGEALFGKLLNGSFAMKLVQVSFGGIVYYIVYQVVILLGLDADMLKMLSAIVVAIFLAIPYLKQKYFSRVTIGSGKEKK
ncbi:MAG: hypothetical protein MJ175_11105, partial [Clostridia bacterium]|nr:hypothetical protein [Clostridia bacterium]